MIFLVSLKMLRKGVDPFSQKGDLDLGRAGVFFMFLIVVNKLCFSLFYQYHGSPSFLFNFLPVFHTA